MCRAPGALETIPHESRHTAHPGSYDARTGGDLAHDQLARDALEDAGGDGGRDKATAPHEEQVRDRALGHRAVLAEQNGIVGPGERGLRLRERGVDVRSRDLAARGSGRIADSAP